MLVLVLVLVLMLLVVVVVVVLLLHREAASSQAQELLQRIKDMGSATQVPLWLKHRRKRVRLGKQTQRHRPAGTTGIRCATWRPSGLIAHMLQLGRCL